MSTILPAANGPARACSPDDTIGKSTFSDSARTRMDTRLIDRRASCPFCGETIELVVDISAGGQSYIEDCQVCCRPMCVTFDSADDSLAWLKVERGD